MGPVAEQNAAGLHPLCREDAQAEALTKHLRQQSPRGQLVSMVQELGPSDWLVARPGSRMSLVQLLEAAVSARAEGVVVDTKDRQEAEQWMASRPQGCALAALPGLAQRAGILASVFYGRPSEQLRVTAVTGTNGKTTVSQGFARSLAWMGRTTVVIGTLGIHRFTRQGDRLAVHCLAPPGLTSLDAVSLQRRLADCLTQGVTDVALEASSIGLAQWRFTGCRFQDAALTSFSQDHLDVHKTMQAYAEAKSLVFQAPGLIGSVRARPIAGQSELPAVLCTGSDILWVRVVHRDAGQTAPSAPITSTTATASTAHELLLAAGAADRRGTPVWLQLPGQPWHAPQEPCWFKPPGQHNLQNAAVVAGLLARQGFTAPDILHCLAHFALPTGRMEPVQPVAEDRPWVYVDYAHTPDALGQVLAALRPLAQQRGGRLICLFGCGGDRDPEKRPIMAQVGASWADWLVITSDNPRSESPQKILQEILSGLSAEALRRATVEEDRRLGIARALEIAATADVVLIAGKGHETTQEIAGSKTPFDDAAIAADLLTTWYGMPSLRAMAAQMVAAGVCSEQSFGRLATWKSDPPVIHVCIDSRSVMPGSVFVAIPGSRVDGHDFLGQAFEKGACAAIVTRPLTAAQESSGQLGPCIVVTDAQQALSVMARVWRGAWRGSLAVVTGSNGKTTVKEMSAAVLRAGFGRHAVWATPGNLNNQLGVPLSILGLRFRHRVAVLEIGMNHPHEVAGLAALARPDLALLTNAQREHQEFMASVRACAEENAQSFQYVKERGMAVVPRDPEHESLWAEMTQSRDDIRHLRFGLADDHEGRDAGCYDGECTARVQSFLPLVFTIVVSPGLAATQAGNDPQFGPAQKADTDGVSSPPIMLAGIGRHLARNAAGAAALGLGMGLSLQQVAEGLAAFTPVAGRGRLHRLGPLQWLVDDSYNANPDSVLAAIEGLSAVDGLHALVLGDMGEVGDQGPVFHAEVLSAARARAISEVLVFGQAMALASDQTAVGRSFDSIEALVAALSEWMDQQQQIQPQTRQTIWVKGSRFMRLERVVQALLSRKEHHASAGLSVAG
ncbi:MAG: UDP-N-acetylmuramyl-tripeptide synthetase [Burkholderiaceae bacterium]